MFFRIETRSVVTGRTPSNGYNPNQVRVSLFRGWVRLFVLWVPEYGTPNTVGLYKMRQWPIEAATSLHIQQGWKPARRLQRMLAFIETILARNLQTSCDNPMMTLDKQDRATVVIALGVAIEHTRKAIEACSDPEFGGARFSEVAERTLEQFVELRQRLQQDSAAS
jgi:hypothetical protein